MDNMKYVDADRILPRKAVMIKAIQLATIRQLPMIKSKLPDWNNDKKILPPDNERITNVKIPKAPLIRCR
jgi:hypothetical protein